MKHPHAILAAFFIFTALVVAAEPGAEHRSAEVRLHSGSVPIGRLGLRLGTYLTIEGKLDTEVKGGVSTMRVEKVNGEQLKDPTDMWIDNLELPENVTCVVKGYESVRMIGSAPAYDDYRKEMGEPEGSQPQAGWQAKCYFVALRVMKPSGLKIMDAKRH